MDARAYTYNIYHAENVLSLSLARSIVIRSASCERARASLSLSLTLDESIFRVGRRSAALKRESVALSEIAIGFAK